MPEALDEDAVERVVGRVGGIAVVRAQRADEAVVVAPQRGDSRRAKLRHGELCRERVQGGEELHEVVDVLRSQRRDAGVALRLHLDEPLLAQPRQGVAHGRPAQAQPAAERIVVERFARHERAVDDRVAELRVGGVAQQVPIDRRRMLRNWHIRCQ